MKNYLDCALSFFALLVIPIVVAWVILTPTKQDSLVSMAIIGICILYLPKQLKESIESWKKLHN